MLWTILLVLLVPWTLVVATSGVFDSAVAGHRPRPGCDSIRPPPIADALALMGGLVLLARGRK